MWYFNGSNWISRTDNVSYTPLMERDPNYGSPGVFSATTHPGSRSQSTCWKMRVRRDPGLSLEDPSNWRDLFLLYGGVSTWTGCTQISKFSSESMVYSFIFLAASFVGSDLFVFDPVLMQWAFLTGPTPPTAVLAAPFDSGVQYPVRLFRSVPVFASDYPTEQVQLEVSGVWKNLVPVYGSASEFSWGSSDFLFNISPWLLTGNVSGIWNCINRCTNSLFGGATSSASPIDARFEPANTPTDVIQPIAWRDRMGRKFRMFGATDGWNNRNEVWMQDQVGWRRLFAVSAPSTGSIDGALQYFQHPTPRRSPNWFVDRWNRVWFHSGLQNASESERSITGPQLEGIFISQFDTAGLDDIILNNPSQSRRLVRFSFLGGETFPLYGPIYHPGRRILTLQAFDSDTGMFYMFSGAVFSNSTPQLWMATVECNGTAPLISANGSALQSTCSQGRFEVQTLRGQCAALDSISVSTLSPLPVMIPLESNVFFRGNITVNIDPDTEIQLSAGNVSSISVLESSGVNLCGCSETLQAQLTFSGAAPCVRNIPANLPKQN
jgi:hypothetical protein